ncbi:MAG: (d)CMP kinase [Haloferacaceae archaeon]
MLLTVSGPPGSGKSTVASGLAEMLGYRHVSGGDIFRGLADERGLSLSEFNELAEEDDSIDRELDRRLREYAREEDDLVLESRLSGWMAGDYADLKIWLDAPLDVRAERIADREGKSVAQARQETIEREESESLRYREYYNIDFDSLQIYDLGLNTARWSPAVTLELVANVVEQYDPEQDEGSYEVPGSVRYEF